ncbi:MAG: hypothetical protein V8S73_13660 [Lachnospiraceae bacterium]
MKKWIKKYFALDTRALQELSGEALAERLFRQRTIVFFIDAIGNIFNTIKAPRLYGFFQGSGTFEGQFPYGAQISAQGSR